MDERKSRSYAYLRVTGYGDAAGISTRLDLVPTAAWSAGDPRPSGHGNYRSTSWKMRTSLPETTHINEHIDWLLTKIGSRTGQIRSLPPDFQPSIVCVAYYAEYQTGGLFLSVDTIQTMGHLGLALDFDIYSEGPGLVEQPES